MPQFMGKRFFLKKTQGDRMSMKPQIELDYQVEFEDIWFDFYCYWIECLCGNDIKETDENIINSKENKIVCNKCKREYHFWAQSKIDQKFWGTECS